MRRLFLSLLFLVPLASFAATPAPVNVPCGWKYTHAITIDRSKCGTVQQSSFPMLVTLPANCLATGNAEVCQSDGGDLRFTSDAVGADGLNCEVVSVTLGSPGTAQVWVRVPTLPASGDAVNQFIYVWYHYMFGTIAQPAASNSTWGSQGVWDTNFDAVWHMEGAASANEPDSTSNGNTLNDTGAVGSTTGEIGKGRNNFTNSAYLLSNAKIGETGAYTISMWANVGTLTTSVMIENTNSVGGVYQYLFYFLSTGYFDAYIALNATNYIGWPSTGTVAANSKHHFAFTCNGSNPLITGSGKVYIDAADNTPATATIAGTPSIPATSACGNTSIGARYEAAADLPFPGWIDEVRIAHTQRSASWITAEYNNMSSPSTFSTATGTGQYTAWWQSLGFLGQ